MKLSGDDMGIIYTLEDKEFRQTIKEASEKVSDLRVPFSIIRREFFRGNKAIFNLKGPGKYEDYKNTKGGKAYRLLKRRLLGSEYPLLKLTGTLEASLTNQKDQNAVDRVSKLELTMGTKVPYAVYHQTGTKKMAKRPVLLIGPEQVAPPSLSKRRDLWIQTIKNYVDKIMSKNKGGL